MEKGLRRLKSNFQWTLLVYLVYHFYYQEKWIYLMLELKLDFIFFFHFGFSVPFNAIFGSQIKL